MRALEGRHGTVARGTEARVSEVVLRARLGEADAEMALWLARRGILFGGGSGGNAAAMAEVEATGRALRKYRAELTVRRREADAEVVRLKELLREYGVVVDGAPSRIGVPLPQGGRDTNPAAAMGSRERTMREMARVKRDLQQRIREARADVDQLTREQRR